MNYPQIMSPVPFASKSGGPCPPAPMEAPPMLLTTVFIRGRTERGKYGNENY